MLKNQILICILSTFSTLFEICSSLSLLSRSRSYAEYPPWKAKESGKLEFEFKTYGLSSLLLYAEESGGTRPHNDRSYIELSLRNGRVHLVIQMGGQDIWSKKRKTFAAGLNDLNWHKIVILRNNAKTSVKIDQWNFDVINQGALKYLPINSSLFVGGVPKSLEHKLVNQGIRSPRFVGCIRNLAYSVVGEPVRPTTLLSGEDVESGCANACTKSKYVPCANSGKCVNEFNTFSCNCKGTGYKGMNCTTPSESAYFRGVELLTYYPRKSSSISNHHVIIRFKTYLDNGILFTAGSQRDFLILEIFQGNVRMAIDLGGGPLELIVGDGNLHDRFWHKIEVIRKGTFCTLKLDDKFFKNGTTPGRNSRYDMRHYDIMYFAGHPDARNLETSKSRQNFSGCMQDVFYNDEDILERTFDFASFTISFIGTVQKGCPVFTPPPQTTSTMTASTTTTTKMEETTKTKEQENEDIVTPSVIKNGNFGSQNSQSSRKEPLSKSQIAWITTGIIVGALVLVFTTACLVHRCKRRYNGFLISSALKNKDNQPRPNQRYKGERVVFLEHGTKEKLDKVTAF